VQEGVLRCFAPSHNPGLVSLSVSLGDHTPISNMVPFEYRERIAENMLVAASGLRQGGEETSGKLWEAFSTLVKLKVAVDRGESIDQDREEKAALLIQSTFRNYTLKKRNEAARTIQKLYRKRYAKRNGAAITIQAAFRGYRKKRHLGWVQRNN